MTKYFTGVKTIEELRKKYRELLKLYHPDNTNGSVEVTQEINAEYDRLFAILSKETQSDNQSHTYNTDDESIRYMKSPIVKSINIDFQVSHEFFEIFMGK